MADEEVTFTNIDEMFAQMNAEMAARLRIVRWCSEQSLAGYNLWYWISSPWKFVTELPPHIYRERKWRRQRSKRGYADSDLWSLDGYLLSWLPDAVKEFRENLHTFPTSMYGDNPNPWSSRVTTDDSDEAFEKWKSILTEMEDGLRAGRRYTDIMDEMTDDEREALRSQFEAAWNLMGTYFFSLWD